MRSGIPIIEPISINGNQKGPTVTDSVLQWNDRIVAEFRANEGSVATNNFGDSLLLLHHRGAKTGVSRVNPLRGMKIDDDSWIVVASKQGADTNPDWYHNLVAHPDAVIDVPGHAGIDVTAETLDGTARDTAWQRFTGAYPIFQQYQDATTRVIPVVALRRRA